MVYVTRKVHFNAAHRLHNADMSDSWNEETYGKCNYPNWHGHNYVMEVTVCGYPDEKTGYVIDLGVLKKILKDRILDKCDHRNLNLDVDFLQGVIPSTENLVMKFYEQLEDSITEHAAEGARLYSVRLFETERNFAEYCPEK